MGCLFHRAFPDGQGLAAAVAEKRSFADISLADNAITGAQFAVLLVCSRSDDREVVFSEIESVADFAQQLNVQTVFQRGAVFLPLLAGLQDLLQLAVT